MKFKKEGKGAYVYPREGGLSINYPPYGRVSKVKSKWNAIFFRASGTFKEREFNSLAEGRDFIDYEVSKDKSELFIRDEEYMRFNY